MYPSQGVIGARPKHIQQPLVPIRRLFWNLQTQPNQLVLHVDKKGMSIVLNPKYLFCDEPNSGLDPQTSLVIDKLIKDLTNEFNTTTIVVTHDMNSVMEIGDHIVYLYQGKKEWEGNNKEIIFSNSQNLNKFIFASEFLQDAKDMRMLEMKGKIDNDRDMNALLNSPGHITDQLDKE